ncbi:DUF4870 domain-containing protein [Staphylococcus ratti]|uniref:DUF4870 domain-containing protein n=1 Tax=Staphylococcus ratti TaxID=2892440 RepID=A0ABY3PAD0_9STAP|nr:DUF4870 domain-containing protein [Staphylococcus ratti]UEX89267.1 DUF4870 domain-containing protein [Staphylococcus ratti]
MSNTSDKILASLCYFSVFFAPILLPLIVWIVAKPPVSKHAKRSLMYHILPWVLFVLGTLLISLSQGASTLYFILTTVIFLGALFFVIYNLYCGVKVLVAHEL